MCPYLSQHTHSFLLVSVNICLYNQIITLSNGLTFITSTTTGIILRYIQELNYTDNMHHIKEQQRCGLSARGVVNCNANTQHLSYEIIGVGILESSDGLSGS